MAMAESEQSRVPPNEDENRVWSIEEVLAEEANAILGPGSPTKVGLDPNITGVGAQKKRFDLNADERTGEDENKRNLNATIWALPSSVPTPFCAALG
jgi:hypothetical protein